MVEYATEQNVLCTRGGNCYTKCITLLHFLDSFKNPLLN